MQNMHVPVPATTANRQRKGADIVVVGNGIAGLTAAVAARRVAPHKRVVIVTEQSHPTINTPALKQFAVGKLEREQLLAYPNGTERNSNIQVLHGRVAEINAHERCIRLAHGSILGYDSLLLATGSTANGLPSDLPGEDFDGVLVLHSLQDYLNLRRRMHEVEDVVVIGGGIHAAETVTCMLQLGFQTHWLIRGKTFLSRMLDSAASAMVLSHIQQRGATVYTETSAIGIAGSVGVVAGVVTNEQQMIACQLVLVCTGSSPDTTLAIHCTQPILHERGRGILVNDQLRTSVPGIYAAGDVAALKNSQTGTHEARAQWYAAVVQGHTAAATMTGTAMEMPFFGVPWHATRIGELSILTVGNTVGSIPGARVYTDNGKGGYRRLAVINDRLVGYLSLGMTQPDGLAIKRIVDEEISLRDVGEALLKGTFDARRFSAQRHTHAVKAIHTVNSLVTSGMLPVIQSAPRSRQLQVPGDREGAPLPYTSRTDTTGAYGRGAPSRSPSSRALDTPDTLSRARHENLTPVSSLSSLPSLPAVRPQGHGRSLWSYNRQRGQFLQEKGS